MQLFLISLFLVITFRLTNCRQCWGFADLEYEGRVENSDKVKITCPGDYCLTLSEEGSDFNVYNGTCPDKSVAITDCETNGVGCKNEKIRDVYIKVCCCNSDLCNESSNNFRVFTLLLMTTLYYIILH